MGYGDTVSPPHSPDGARYLQRLRDRHRKLDRQIAEADAGVLPLGDDELAARKRERLQVKQAIAVADAAGG